MLCLCTAKLPKLKGLLPFQVRDRYFTLPKSARHTFLTHEGKKIGPWGWFLLLIPGSTFALGTWQVQRKKWKENLIAELKARTGSNPVPLPESLEEIAKLEYKPVYVKGHFLHDKEVYIGPRSLIKDGDASTTSMLISKGQNEAHGYLVVTPFKVANREQTILVNRGWVPHSMRDSKKRPTGQVQGEVDVVGIMRLHEPRPVFMPHNKPQTNLLLYRDLEQLCTITNADPIFLDATTDFDIAGGPIGGQTRITLRNEHLSYILTWYCLSIVSGTMWYLHFVKGVKI